MMEKKVFLVMPGGRGETAAVATELLWEEVMEAMRAERTEEDDLEVDVNPAVLG